MYQRIQPETRLYILVVVVVVVGWVESILIRRGSTVIRK